MNTHLNAILISITATMFLAMVLMMSESSQIYSQKIIPQDEFSEYHGSKMPELGYYDKYDELRAQDKTVVIYPIFTQSAYEWGGFHDFYTNRCGTCFIIKIQNSYEKDFASSGNGFRILEFLGYEVIDDIDLDKNPEILKKYNKVILLHNEFVTKAEFDAITNHPNVVYLYPNALSSEVETNYLTNSLTLIRGPGYPDEKIVNGFDWEYDNSEYFQDWKCKDWKFYKVENGHMLNCYPETKLPLFGYEILKTMTTL